MNHKKGFKDKIMGLGLLRLFLRNSLAMTTTVIASERSERNNIKAIIFTLFSALVFIFSNTMIAHSDTVTAQTGEEVTQPGNVTLIFRDADIRTVLHALSYKSGVNIVASSDVEGAVSIRLIDVPWETALEVILKNHGLAAERVGNIIRVITLANVAEEELQNEVFILNYAKAKEIADAIDATVTNRGRIKYDERTNTLIVTDIPTNLYKVRTVVSRLDRRTPQVAIEARLIEAKLGKDDKLGIEWNMEVRAQGASRPTTFPFESEKAPFAKPKSGGSIKDYLPGTFPTTFPLTGVGSFQFGTLDFTQLTAALKLLNERTDTSVISNPTITTLNNKEAKIIVGQIFNIPTYERNDQTGKMEITGYTEKDIGIILTVTPHINEVNDIVVDLKPEVTALFSDDWDVFGTGDNAIYAPRFTTRTAQTQVMIKDGQTIVIGGLRENATVKVDKKVPFLGDIPLVGELFKYKADTIDTKDLLIFVTVRLVSEEKDDRPIMDQAIRDFFDVKEPEDMVYR
jgi:type IV pilus assembly protein PilQ